MKQTHSRSFSLPARASVAAACAVILGSAAALAQTSGTSSTQSGTPSNTDRYGTGSTSSTNDEYKRDRSTQTNASTSGAAAGSQAGRTSSDRTTTIDRDRSADRDRSGTYDRSTDRTTAETYGSSTQQSGKLAWRERRFVTKAADHGMAELNLAQLAAERASNPEVRSYAQKLVEDHEKVKSELTILAGQKNVKLDTDDDGKDRTYRRLSNKSGRDFDEEYVEHMIEMHEDDVKMFEKMASDGKDSDLRSFASKHIDHLREHLQQAQNLRQSIMPTGRDDVDRSSTGATDTSTSSSTSRTSTDTSTDATRSDTSTPDADTSTRSGSSSPDTSDSSSSTPRR